MILYFEREDAEKRRDWLLRLANSSDAEEAFVFRQQAERLTREIDECKKREAEAHV